jgi:NAD(P)-dependent dehydrogenase (short-subunit alcohol dehydrogenase family)
MTQNKVWFITGTSRGFGRLWTEAALQRGDKVVATARDPKTLNDLVNRFGDTILPLALDVTDRDAVFASVKRGAEHFGRLDIVISNAGYGALGMIEEIDFETARNNFDTNFFGTLSLIQAVLPLLRAQGSGHILPVSSGAGLVALPTGGVYSSSKFAVNALGDTLSQEVADFGIKVTIIEPGPFNTDFSGSSLVAAKPMPEYAAIHAEMAKFMDHASFPDPRDTIAPLLRAIDMEEPPLHLLMGHIMLPMIEQVYEKRLQTLRQGAALSD